MALPLRHPETISFRANKGKTAEAFAHRAADEKPGAFWRRMLDEWLAMRRAKQETETT